MIRHTANGTRYDYHGPLPGDRPEVKVSTMRESERGKNMDSDNVNNEQVTMAMVMLASALGIDPAAMMLAGRTVPEGYELRVLIVPDEDDQTAEMRAKVEEAMREV